MASLPTWLPALIRLADSNGDWNRYVEMVYRYFRQDFIRNPLMFAGQPIQLKRHPMEQGKEAVFWHLVSEGEIEADRLPDLRRCERIRWVRPIIEHAATDSVKVWENTRKGEIRICLWCEEAEFLVILAKRSTYYLLWTAYPIVEEHRKRKLRKEYEAYKKLASP